MDCAKRPTPAFDEECAAEGERTVAMRPSQGMDNEITIRQDPLALRDLLAALGTFERTNPTKRRELLPSEATLICAGVNSGPVTQVLTRSSRRTVPIMGVPESSTSTASLLSMGVSSRSDANPVLMPARPIATPMLGACPMSTAGPSGYWVADSRRSKPTVRVHRGGQLQRSRALDGWIWLSVGVLALALALVLVVILGVLCHARAPGALAALVAHTLH